MATTDHNVYEPVTSKDTINVTMHISTISKSGKMCDMSNKPAAHK